MSTFRPHPAYWVTRPDTLGQATLGVTITLGILSTIVMALRLHMRYSHAALGLDDYLMAVACAFYVTCCVFTSLDVYAGLGTYDNNLPDPSMDHTWNIVMGSKWFAFFQFTYCWTLPFIKASIGTTLMRVAPQRRFRYPIMATVTMSALGTSVGFVLLLTFCKPLTKTWMGDRVEGTCTTAELYRGFSYLISIVIIITDWSCAIIFASIGTLIRWPYLMAYTSTTDVLHNKANIVVWSMIEMGVGILAGSLPSLRGLIKRWFSSLRDMDPDDAPGAANRREYHLVPQSRDQAVFPNLKPRKEEA